MEANERVKQRDVNDCTQKTNEEHELTKSCLR